MPRVPRSKLGEGVYHVINRGINRSFIFEDEEDKGAFFGLLVEYRKRFSLRVLHWVIMGNHFHLVFEVLKVQDLTAFMAGLQRRYTAFHHRRRRERGDDACGYLWQGRFKSPLIERESHLFAVGRYVERNPVRAKLIETPWEYPWSSARAYALGEKDGLTDVSYNTSFSSLGRTADERQAEWRDYLTDPEARGEEHLFRGGRNPVGSEAFQSRIVLRSGRQTTAHPGARK